MRADTLFCWPVFYLRRIRVIKIFERINSPPSICCGRLRRTPSPPTLSHTFPWPKKQQVNFCYNMLQSWTTLVAVFVCVDDFPALLLLCLDDNCCDSHPSAVVHTRMCSKNVNNSLLLKSVICTTAIISDDAACMYVVISPACCENNCPPQRTPFCRLSRRVECIRISTQQLIVHDHITSWQKVLEMMVIISNHSACPTLTSVVTLYIPYYYYFITAVVAFEARAIAHVASDYPPKPMKRFPLRRDCPMFSLSCPGAVSSTWKMHLLSVTLPMLFVGVALGERPWEDVFYRWMLASELLNSRAFGVFQDLSIFTLMQQAVTATEVSSRRSLIPRNDQHTKTWTAALLAWVWARKTRFIQIITQLQEIGLSFRFSFCVRSKEHHMSNIEHSLTEKRELPVLLLHVHLLLLGNSFLGQLHHAKTRSRGGRHLNYFMFVLRVVVGYSVQCIPLMSSEKSLGFQVSRVDGCSKHHVEDDVPVFRHSSNHTWSWVRSSSISVIPFLWIPRVRHVWNFFKYDMRHCSVPDYRRTVMSCRGHSPHSACAMRCRVLLRSSAVRLQYGTVTWMWWHSSGIVMFLVARPPGVSLFLTAVFWNPRLLRFRWPHRLKTSV